MKDRAFPASHKNSYGQPDNDRYCNSFQPGVLRGGCADRLSEISYLRYVQSILIIKPAHSADILLNTFQQAQIYCQNHAAVHSRMKWQGRCIPTCYQRCHIQTGVCRRNKRSYRPKPFIAYLVQRRSPVRTSMPIPRRPGSSYRLKPFRQFDPVFRNRHPILHDQ